VTVGPYKPIAEFIKLARQLKVDAAFVAISFVRRVGLLAQSWQPGRGVIVSQVVPFPGDNSLPVVTSYQAAPLPLIPILNLALYRSKAIWSPTRR
jgi:hypothetical protein